MDLLGSLVSPSDNDKKFGVTFGSDFTFSDHVSTVCRACFIKSRTLTCIRRYLNLTTATMLANVLVSSKLDYCNSLFASISKNEWRRMQLVQNTLCRVCLWLPWGSHASKIMRFLHWLPVKYRINFKLDVTLFKTMLYGLPMDLHEYLVHYTYAVNTRRSNPDKLI